MVVWLGLRNTRAMTFLAMPFLLLMKLWISSPLLWQLQGILKLSFKLSKTRLTPCGSKDSTQEKSLCSSTSTKSILWEIPMKISRGGWKRLSLLLLFDQSVWFGCCFARVAFVPNMVWLGICSCWSSTPSHFLLFLLFRCPGCGFTYTSPRCGVLFVPSQAWAFLFVS